MHEAGFSAHVVLAIPLIAPMVRIRRRPVNGKRLRIASDAQEGASASSPERNGWLQDRDHVSPDRDHPQEQRQRRQGRSFFHD
jgi:hypothetical protein